MRWVESGDKSWLRQEGVACGVDLNAEFVMKEHKLTTKGYLWQGATTTGMIKSLVDLGLNTKKPAVINRKKPPKDAIQRGELNLPSIDGVVEWELLKADKSWRPKNIKRRMLQDSKTKLSAIGKWCEDADRQAAIISMSAKDLTPQQWAKPYRKKFSRLSNEHPMLDFWRGIDALESEGKIFKEALTLFSQSWDKENNGKELWVEMLAHAAGAGMVNRGSNNCHFEMLKKDSKLVEKLMQVDTKHARQFFENPNTLKMYSKSMLEWLNLEETTTDYWHSEKRSIVTVIANACDKERCNPSGHPAWECYMRAYQLNPESINQLPEALKVFLLKSLDSCNVYEIAEKKERGQIKKVSMDYVASEDSFASQTPSNKTKLCIELLNSLGAENPLSLGEVRTIMRHSIESPKDEAALEAAYLSASVNVKQGAPTTRRKVL